MSPIAWESFVTRIMAVTVNALQGIIRIAVIVAAAYVTVKLLRAALSKFEALLIRTTGYGETYPGAAAKRIKTLSSVLWTISSGLLWFVVVLITLSQIGVNIGPILAGAGVVGLAVGFGAQHLVRDLVSGFFLLLENQIRVGDMAIVNGTGGVVESVTFRTVALRDQAGLVHVFPNGSITTLADYVSCVGCVAAHDGRCADHAGIPAFVVALLFPLRRGHDALDFVGQVDAALQREAQLFGPRVHFVDPEHVDRKSVV